MSSPIGGTPEYLRAGDLEQLEKVAKGESPITQKTAVLAERLFASIESVKHQVAVNKELSQASCNNFEVAGNIYTSVQLPGKLETLQELSKNICLKSIEATKWHPIWKILSAIKNILCFRGMESSAESLRKTIDWDRINPLISELKEAFDNMAYSAHMDNSQNKQVLFNKDVDLLALKDIKKKLDDIGIIANMYNMKSLEEFDKVSGPLITLNNMLGAVDGKIKELSP